MIRFLTETDYPPFNFAGPDGNPQGFNVDLARMMCEELKVGCTVQMRRFETLFASLNENRGDAVIASLAATADARARSISAIPITARRRVSWRGAIRRSTIRCRRSSKARRSPWSPAPRMRPICKALFTEVEVRPYPSAEVARLALRRGDVDLLFGDAISLAFWLNGTDSENCCAFRGGPYLDSRYFGEGIGIAVRKGNDALRLALNWALFRVWEQGRFTDLWLRYFPISPF